MNTGRKMMKLESPKLLYSDLLNLALSHIQSRDMFEVGMIQDTVIEHQHANKVIFDKIVFKNVTFLESSLTGIELTDVIFENCDLSNIDFSNAIIHRTQFKECKMIGINLTDATLRNVLFEHCLADYATFRLSNSKAVVFAASSLLGSDFCFCTFNKVELHGVELDQAQFTATKLKGVDLSDSQFGSLGVDVDQIKGCIISREQAYVFAGLLGLIVNK